MTHWALDLLSLTDDQDSRGIIRADSAVSALTLSVYTVYDSSVGKILSL